MNITTYEIYKPNAMWISSRKYDTLEAAHAVALEKSATYRETYAIRETHGHTVAVYDCGVKFVPESGHAN